MVERKYREGLNKEMERLRNTLPSLTAAASSRSGSGKRNSIAAGAKTEDDEDDDNDDIDEEDGEGQGKQHGGVHRPSKAVVLQTAVEEIEMLRRERVRLEGEVERMGRERDKWKREVEILRGEDGRGGRGRGLMGMG
jgi:hypothetical protein